MKKNLVIFDLDGTLLNTYEDLGNAVNYVLAKYNYPTHDLIAYKTFIGNGIDNLLKTCLPSEFSNEELYAFIRKEFVNYYEANKYNLTHPYEGIMDLLQELESKSIKLAIASNKYHEATVELTNRYFPEIKFDLVLGHRTNEPKKPDPKILLDILNQTQSTKEQSFFVGDSSVDMKTAHYAKIESIGVTWGFRSEEELRNHQADYIVHQPNEILKFI